MKLNYNRFFLHSTEMRISTHIKSFLRFKLKLLTLVTCQFNFFLPNCDIFVTFFVNQKLNFVPLNNFVKLLITFNFGGGGGKIEVVLIPPPPPSVCPFTNPNPNPPPPPGQTSGRLKGSKGANFEGGELNVFFLQFEIRFRNGLGRTLALKSFRITHLLT